MMDYFESDSYINPGLPKITTIPSSSHVSQQTQTPTSTSSSVGHVMPPSIDEVLSGNSQAPYTRNHFAQYLLQRHCLENLEFYLEIEKFLNLTSFIEKEYNWKFLYNNFIEVESPKEINLPASVRDNFSVDIIPTNQDLQEASKVVFGYLHEVYVGFISSKEVSDNYCLTAPVPLRRPSSTDQAKRQSQIQTHHLFDAQGRCISPLSPSTSTTTTTPIHRPALTTDDNDFPFEMSDDDIDQQSDEKRSSRDRLTSNPVLEECVSNVNHEESYSTSGRNSSVSSNYSNSVMNNKFNIVGSFKSNDSNWKKAAKKLKWRRSSNSSSE